MPHFHMAISNVVVLICFRCVASFCSRFVCIGYVPVARDIGLMVIIVIRANTKVRTWDLRFTKSLLCRLSYVGVSNIIIV